MGGMVLETNMNEIVAQVELQNRMEKSEVIFYLESRQLIMFDNTLMYTWKGLK